MKASIPIDKSEGDLLYMWCAMIFGLANNVAKTDVRLLFHIVSRSERGMWFEGRAATIKALDMNEEGYKSAIKSLRKKKLITYDKPRRVWVLHRMLFIEKSRKTKFEIFKFK